METKDMKIAVLGLTGNIGKTSLAICILYTKPNL
ncbi:1-deoxy-D-xylulose 5-phosphate reductoisomerase [Oxalobacteraceae bacterium GrIS 2.11]